MSIPQSSACFKSIHSWRLHTLNHDLHLVASSNCDIWDHSQHNLQPRNIWSMWVFSHKQHGDRPFIGNIITRKSGSGEILRFRLILFKIKLSLRTTSYFAIEPSTMVASTVVNTDIRKIKVTWTNPTTPNGPVPGISAIAWKVPPTSPPDRANPFTHAECLLGYWCEHFHS